MIRSIFINFSARLTMQVMYFCTLLLTTHLLGSEVRGEISLIQIAINIIHLVSDIIGGPALVYMAPRAKLRTLLLTGWTWTLFSSGITWSILVWQDAIPAGYTIPVLISAVLLSLNSISMNILLGQERLKQYNLLLYLQGALMLGSMAASILLLNHANAVPYMEATYIAYGGCAALGLYFVFNKPHIPKLTDSRPVLLVLFANGIFTQLANLTFQLSIRFGYYKLEDQMHDDRHSVGIYSTAISLGEAILLFAASVASVLAARISNERITELSRQRTLQLSKLSISLTIPAVLFFAFMPASFYTWLLGDSFSAVRDSFRSITPGIIAVSFGTIFGHYFTGTGRPYMNFMSGSFALILTLLTAGGIIGAYGVIGAGLSASIAYTGLSIFIFSMFMITGGNFRAEMKELVPRKSDVTALLNVFRQPKDDKPSAE
jgi:O-antigen/teichoic acid export membrane protein